MDLACGYRGDTVGKRVPPAAADLPGVHACKLVGLTVLERCQSCTLRDPLAIPEVDPIPMPNHVVDHPPAAMPAVPPPAPRLSPEQRKTRHRRRREPGVPTIAGAFPEMFTTRDEKPLHLGNMYAGRDIFVLLPGPSLANVDFSKLRQPGIQTFSVNNAGTMFPCDFWTFVDPVEKFHEVIWRNPSTLKLVPFRKLKEKIRRQWHDGRFQVLSSTPCRNLPNVVGYHRNCTFDPATFLTEPTVNWGNNDKGHAINKRPKLLNVMLAMFKLCWALGFRRVNLLGCDFKMNESRPYAFDEEKHAAGVGSNNNTYLTLTWYLDQLKPVFDKAGFAVYNLNERSGLRTFPFTTLDEAIKHARATFPDWPTCTSGWYTKQSQLPAERRYDEPG